MAKSASAFVSRKMSESSNPEVQVHWALNEPCLVLRKKQHVECSGKVCLIAVEALEVGLQEMFESGGSPRRILELGGWGKFRWDIHFVAFEVFIMRIYLSIICEAQRLV